MLNEPNYEIVGFTCQDMVEKFQDCLTVDDAIVALKEWQKDGYDVWVVEKETRKALSLTYRQKE